MRSGSSNFRFVVLSSPSETESLPRVPPPGEPRALGSSLRCCGRGAAAVGGGGGGGRDAEFPGAGGEDGGRQGPPALPAHRGGRQVSGRRMAGPGPPGLRQPGRDRRRGPAPPCRPCSGRGLRGPASFSVTPDPDPRPSVFPGLHAPSSLLHVSLPPMPSWQFSLLRLKLRRSPSYRSPSAAKLLSL